MLSPVATTTATIGQSPDMLSMSGKDFGSPFQALSQASSVGNISCEMLQNRKKKHIRFQDWQLPVVQASARRFFYWSCPSSPLSSTSVHLPHLLCPFLTLSLMTDTTLAVTVLNSCNDRATFWSRWVSSSSSPPPPSPCPYSPACTNLRWKPTKVDQAFSRICRSPISKGMLKNGPWVTLENH